MIDTEETALITNESPKPSKQKKKAKPPSQSQPENPTVAAPPQLSPGLNLADLKRMRLPQTFNQLAVKKALVTVPVRKPAREWWVKTHSDPSYCFDAVVLELKEESETYLVAPELFADLSTESTVSIKRLYAATTSTGVIFLWPVKLPGPDGRLDEWSRSALLAAEMASKGKWVRMQSNRTLGAYEVSTTDDTKQPVWPEESMEALMHRAFRDKYLHDTQHPVLKRLRGEL